MGSSSDGVVRRVPPPPPRRPLGDALEGIRLSVGHPLPGLPLAALRSLYDEAEEEGALEWLEPPRQPGRPRKDDPYAPWRGEAEAEAAAVKAMWKKPRGKPGRTDEGLFVRPLRVVYLALRRYWSQTTGRKHPPLRLFEAVVNDLDHRFSHSTIHNLHDRMRKSRK